MLQKKKSSSIPAQLIVVGIVLMVLVIIFLILILNKNSATQTPENLLENQTTETNNQNDEKDSVIFDSADLVETVDNLDSAIASVVGTSLVTEDGKVINNKGQVVQNNATPMTDLAPKLSEPIDPETLTSGTIKLTADEKGFSPVEFTVKSGEPLTLSLTAINVGSRLVFENKSLSALELPIPAGYTMAKTFNAPEPGRYVFFQDMPGRNDQKGVMIVVQ